MKYIEKINTQLTPHIDKELNKTVIDLFAGCGGLSLGFEAMGFKTIGYEKLEDAAETYRKNLLGECYTQELTVETKYPKAEIIIGGATSYGYYPNCIPSACGSEVHFLI